MVGNDIIEGMIDYRSVSHESDGIWGPIAVLSPEVTHLEQAAQRMATKHDLDDALINTLTTETGKSAYVVGILAGLHFAGRVDLVPKVARIYAQITGADDLRPYDEDGSMVLTSTAH